MERIKKIPLPGKVLMVVMVVAILLSVTTLGLYQMEEKQQKPRVIKAFSDLMMDAASEKYSMEGFWNLLDSGKITHKGAITVTDIEEALLTEKYRFIVPYIDRSSLEFTIRKDDENRQMDFQLETVRKEGVTGKVDGYLDDKVCSIHVPDIYGRYLTFSPDNLKEQYEASLLHTVFGDSLPLPECSLTNYVFTGAESALCAEKEVLLRRLSVYAENAKDMYEQITVNKTERKDEILWNGNYESCTAYELIVPTELINQFFLENVWEKMEHTLALEKEVLSLQVYLSSDKRLLKLETDADILLDGVSVPTALVFYPKGVENAWDSVLVELEVTWDDIIYGANLVLSNEFSEKERILHGSVSMTQPYVTELLAADVRYEPESGTADLDFVWKTPLLSMDGIYHIEALTESPEKPQDAVAIFETDLFDILKLTNEINWSFFKKQE